MVVVVQTSIMIIHLFKTIIFNSKAPFSLILKGVYFSIKIDKKITDIIK